MAMIIGDCLAIALLELKGFKSTNFKNIHPGGNLGKDLKYLREVMHINKKIPLAKKDEKMSKALITMTSKSFGCIGVIDKSNKIIGLIIKNAMMVFLYHLGESPRNILYKFFIIFI